MRPLAVDSSDKKASADWVKLSRKHEIATNKDDKHISIFGGKLTDCLNVGEEVAGLVADLGVDLAASDSKWYGEASAVASEHERQDEACAEQKLRGDVLCREPLVRCCRSRGFGRVRCVLALALIDDRPRHQLPEARG